jgi:uncharacterized protein
MIEKQIGEQITDADLDWLEEILSARIDEDEYYEGMDEGIINISELDGFFTAIVSGPQMIPPSQWLPLVWGDFEPDWESAEQFERVFNIMINIMNSIVFELMEEPENYQPVFAQNLIDGQEYLIVDEWCFGYTRGIQLFEKEWNIDSEPMSSLIIPIVIFGSEDMFGLRDSLDPEEIHTLQQQITPNAKQIHAYWLALRENQELENIPFQNTEPRPGRNDPCPCGSGKKYKKCCLH